ESPTYPSAARCVGAVAPERSRSAALAWLFTGSSIGAAVAGPAAIALEAHFNSFRVAFLGIALVGALYAPLFWKVTGHPSVKPLVERRESPMFGSEHPRKVSHPFRDFADLLREPAVQ